jgi:hypothetical protein
LQFNKKIVKCKGNPFHPPPRLFHFSENYNISTVKINIEWNRITTFLEVGLSLQLIKKSLSPEGNPFHPPPRLFHFSENYNISPGKINIEWNGIITFLEVELSLQFNKKIVK